MSDWLRISSLRGRLAGAVLVAVIAVLALLWIAIRSAIASGSAQEFDERLMQQAQVILAYAGHEYAETGTVVPEAMAQAGPAAAHEVIYQVWTLDGVAVHRSAGAPLKPLVAIQDRGFATVQISGAQWRAYALAARDAPLVVQIAELASHRNLIAERARRAVRTPVLIALPLLAALVWWLTTAALRPVDRLARAVRTRSAGDVAPLDVERMPDEITALGSELNSLLARQRDALNREQRFTADAAHELRTPLAAVRAQAQVALRAQSPAERERALQQLIAGVDRSGRLITQLLSLARLTPGNPSVMSSTRAIDEVLADVLHDLETSIERSAVRIHIEPPVASVRLPQEPAYLLLRNLVDNAIRHSPAGGSIQVALHASQRQLHIRIADQGPGIPAEHRQAVLDRFRRLNDSYAGSGLGLSIVAQVVELLQGRIEMRDADPAPGLAVEITLPLNEAGDAHSVAAVAAVAQRV